MRFIGVIFHGILRLGIIEFFVVFFILINISTFFLYVIDKQKAVKGKWRIRERTLIFFTLTCGGIGAFFGMWLAKHKTSNKKFRIAVLVGLAVALVPALHIAHSFTLDRVIRFKEIEFHSENWPAELDGYRIAFMTDMHVITDADMGGVIAELNERDIDLLLLGGDFTMRDAHYKGTLREIAQAVTTDGIFGVEGNHDDYRRLFSAKEQLGIIPLDNSGILIREGFYLAGVQDMWNRSPNIQAAISGAYSSDFVLLVSHNPDVSMMQSTNSIDLILSGHTHGGQITFFGFPMYLLRGSITDYGIRFGYGFSYSADQVPVFVSSGIGVYYSIPRIFARPEVVIFTMYSSKQ